ncbi:hypothetical protein ENSA5_61560 [Enhygromyxa salina]|uniref:Uncharacterized protein n=1 Tax=Enhygromyxa salina TaxID=215803 RepID=A0A2S9XCZ0_9BACT|nr:hypothetical protein ENSA5_61560 [Enhygromyxa salina]
MTFKPGEPGQAMVMDPGFERWYASPDEMQSHCMCMTVQVAGEAWSKSP